MIKEVSGDILMSKATMIAHGVAPYDHFDSGLALSLREHWPNMFKDFRHFCHVSNPKPGAIWAWKNGSGPQIVNLMTQEPSSGHNHAGRPGKASLPYVNKALHELKKMIETEACTSVAIPRLATGVGGLDWEEVKPIIYEVLGKVDANVYVYSTYVKGMAAGE